jgi:V/A-type H+-transporting ATPase subunit D
MFRSKIKLIEEMSDSISEWVAVIAEPVPLEEYVEVQTVDIEYIPAAGVLIPAVRSIQFRQIACDLFMTPLWLDTAVQVIKALITLYIEADILEQQLNLLREELRITTQRVNLFEIVKIPEAQDTIRRIQIALADQQTASVVRGKIAKRKMSSIQL